jgi:hypothetical protein
MPRRLVLKIKQENYRRETNEFAVKVILFINM